MTTNPRDEKQRLEGVYSAMNDGELQSLAEDAASLTPEAVNALRAELSRRKLNVPVDDANPGWDEIQPRDLVTIRKFLAAPEAMIAKGLLESAGIECFVMDDNTARMYVSNAVGGGVRLQVNRTDAKMALEILEQPTPESAGYEENAEDEFDTKP